MLALATVLAVVIFAAGLLAVFLGKQVMRLHRLMLQRAARRLAQPLGAFPVQPLGDRPGRFRVRGVLRDTEEEVDWLIDADMAANAAAKAELRGLVVTRVEWIADVAAEPAPEERGRMADVGGPAAAGANCLAV
jgi:hypothetical protein